MSVVVFRPVREDHLALGIADARMLLRRVIHFAPGDEPQKSQQPGYHKNRAPSPPQVNRQYDEGRDGAADGRAAVIQRGRQSTFAIRKPLGDGLARARPIGGLARAKQETERREAGDAAGQWGQQRDDGIPRDADGQAKPGAQAINLAAANGLSDGVGHPKRYGDIGVVRVGPVVLLLEKWREDGKGLTIDVVDHG